MKRLIPFLIIALAYSCDNQNPEIRPSALISNHMVLQQNTNVPLFGYTEAGLTIEAQTSWGAAGKATADTNGFWKIMVNTPSAGGPYTIKLMARKTEVLVEDVLIGEVWLCSGQSNMEMSLNGWPPTDTVNNYKTEIAEAKYPEIRMFTVEKNLTFNPVTDCKGEWLVCSPETAGSFSATAYFFGRELNTQLDVPIGLIHSSWGGSPAESWTAVDYLSDIEGYNSIKTDIANANQKLSELKKWLSNLDSINLKNLQPDKPYQNIKLDDNQYSLAEFDDSQWESMSLPGLWEPKGLTNFDGVVWFRKEFEMPGKYYPEGFELQLGPVDDMDATYINGIKIGGFEEEGFWKTNRVYSIPQSALKEGKNVVAVRITDTRGGGGIYGKTISITKGNKEIINLDGEWKYLPVAVIYNNIMFRFSEGNKSYSYMPQPGLTYEYNTPTLMYNGMIAPLVPYTIKGVIWYQGESNVGRGKQYQTLFPAMVQNWRDMWQLGDIPFYYVQIAPYDYGESASSATAELREAQLLSLKEKNVGMVVTMDIGNPRNIHPANKQEVGRRLALLALAKNYSFSDILFSGPLYKSAEFEGSKAIVEFDYCGEKLVSNGEKLISFEIADTTGVFFPAEATIDSNKVIVFSKKVKKPAMVRYAWDDDVVPNLFNSEGLPASPFRTN